jgi:hypothetical protein
VSPSGAPFGPASETNYRLRAGQRLAGAKAAAAWALATSPGDDHGEQADNQQNVETFDFSSQAQLPQLGGAQGAPAVTQLGQLRLDVDVDRPEEVDIVTVAG